MTPSTIGGIIRDARQSLGLKLDHVARATSIATSTLSKIETGYILNPGILTIVRICGVLGISHEAIIEAARKDLKNADQSS